MTRTSKRIKRSKDDAKESLEVLKKSVEYILQSSLARRVNTEREKSSENAENWFKGIEIEARIVRYQWLFDKSAWQRSRCTIPECDIDPFIADLKKRSDSKDWEFSRDVYYDVNEATLAHKEEDKVEANQRNYSNIIEQFNEGKRAHPRIDTSYRQTSKYIIDPDDENDPFKTVNGLGIKRKIAQIDLRPCYEPSIGSSKKKSIEEKRKQLEYEEEYEEESDFSKIETISGRSVYGIRICASLEWETDNIEEFKEFASKLITDEYEVNVEEDKSDEQKTKTKKRRQPKKKRRPGFEMPLRVRYKARKSFLRKDGSNTRYDLTYCNETDSMTNCEIRCKKFFENCENRRKRKRVAYTWEDVEPVAELEVEFDMKQLAINAKNQIISQNEEERCEQILTVIVNKMVEDISDIVVPNYGFERFNEIGL